MVEENSSTTDTTNEPFLPVWATIALYLFVSFIMILFFSGLLMLLFLLIPPVNLKYSSLVQGLPQVIGSLLGAWLCAILFLKVFDRRPVSELGLSIKGRWADCVVGLLFAAVLYVVGFGVSLIMGVVEVAGIHFDAGVLVASFGFFFLAAAMEEIMIRGYIQGRLMSTRMNKFLALALASVVFSLLHIFNPNLSVLAMVNLWLAGLLLGASYLYTRNLWFPIFLHTAWNWIQGPVLGYGVSGQQLCPSALRLYMPDENMLNGGKFGFEGSIICSILCVLGTLAIVWWYERKKV